jgi:hypothetical protein
MSQLSLADIKDVVGIIASIAALIGGFIGLRRYLDDRHTAQAQSAEKFQLEQRQAFRDWQKVVVHKIIQTEDTDAVEFKDILQRYQQEAIALEGYDSTKADLGADTLRRVILEMVSAGILKQVGVDQYEIKSK